MNVLDINNVTKRFGNLVAVRDVSLSVAKGEMCAIIGPNGAGKTTFIDAVTGFVPYTGKVRLGGKPMDRLTAARRLFRHGDDRVRPGVLLHRLPVEFTDRR